METPFWIQVRNKDEITTHKNKRTNISISKREIQLKGQTRIPVIGCLEVRGEVLLQPLLNGIHEFTCDDPGSTIGATA